MPRIERKQSKTGIYHVMIRGINKQLLFEDEEDYTKMLSILAEVKAVSDCKIYAYCLMGNHAHFLIKEGREPLSHIFKRLGSRYVYWFNQKYERSGHLYQDRFRSEPIESDEYFAMVLLYIYQNPVKAGLCKHPKDYKWSSRNQLGRCEMVDETELLDIIDIDAIIREESEEVHVEYLEPKIGRRLAMPDAAALSKIKAISGVKSMSEFQSLERAAQGEALVEAGKQGVSQRQLARLTGLGRTVIIRLCKNTNQ